MSLAGLPQTKTAAGDGKAADPFLPPSSPHSASKKATAAGAGPRRASSLKVLRPGSKRAPNIERNATRRLDNAAAKKRSLGVGRREAIRTYVFGGAFFALFACREADLFLRLFGPQRASGAFDEPNNAR